jgi:hypothetical protein
VFDTDDLKNSVIVAAHPDDEILWFSSLLKRVGRIVLCFSDEMADPEFGARRKKMVADYPLKNASSIHLASMGVWRPRSFLKPRFNEYGIELVGNDHLHSAHRKKYQENYSEMRDRLADVLMPYRHVFTHNPWGEYGHEEHIQVHRVICDLQKKYGYDIWYSSYCSTRTLGLIDPRACMTDSITLSTDVDTAEQLMAMYKRYGCWTWYLEWCWPMEETFFKRGAGNLAVTDNGKLVNLHLIFLPLVSPETTSRRSRIRQQLRALNPAAVVRKVRTLAKAVFDPSQVCL